MGNNMLIIYLTIGLWLLMSLYWGICRIDLLQLQITSWANVVRETLSRVIMLDWKIKDGFGGSFQETLIMTKSQIKEFS